MSNETDKPPQQNPQIDIVTKNKGKHHVKHLSLLSISSPHAFNIVKTNVSDRIYCTFSFWRIESHAGKI